jgi:hypothetical protein
VLGLEKDVERLVDDSHAALAQPPLEVVAAVENRLAAMDASWPRRHRDKTQFRRKTGATGWHSFIQCSITALTTPRESGFAEDFNG